MSASGPHHRAYRSQTAYGGGVGEVNVINVSHVSAGEAFARLSTASSRWLSGVRSRVCTTVGPVPRGRLILEDVVLARRAEARAVLLAAYTPFPLYFSPQPPSRSDIYGARPVAVRLRCPDVKRTWAVFYECIKRVAGGVARRLDVLSCRHLPTKQRAEPEGPMLKPRENERVAALESGRRGGV